MITETKLAIVMPPKLLLIKPKTGKVKLTCPQAGKECPKVELFLNRSRSRVILVFTDDLENRIY
jgi:hypothetical protein